MPPMETPLTEETVVDISHESLMRGWQRLNAWVEEEAESIKLYKRLAESAQLNVQEKTGLLREPELSIVEKWLQEEKPSQGWLSRFNNATDDEITYQYLLESREKKKLDEISEIKLIEKEVREAKKALYVETILKKKLINRLIISIASTLLMTCMLITTILQARSVRNHANEAKLQARRAEVEKRRADDLVDQLTTYGSETLRLLEQAAHEGQSASDVLDVISAQLQQRLDTTVSTQGNLTLEEAVEIIDKWLSSRPRIFSPPFDESLAQENLTSKALENVLESIKWLRNNAFYYEYKSWEITNVWAFYSESLEAEAIVQIKDDLTLHSPKGIQAEYSGERNQNYRFTFELKDDKWKISHYIKYQEDI